ncbi:hypothetical protein Pan5_46 [Pseudanabaena phage Pan5]|nr:hypothetical protein Pan5_46 [Pseudanabaena phage Pan5]
MDKKEIWNLVNQAYKKGKKESPGWPDHVAAQAGIVNAEAGKLMTEALLYKYSKNKNKMLVKAYHDDMKKSAIHTIVTAIRFLENLKS